MCIFKVWKGKIHTHTCVQCTLSTIKIRKRARLFLRKMSQTFAHDHTCNTWQEQKNSILEGRKRPNTLRTRGTWDAVWNSEESIVKSFEKCTSITKTMKANATMENCMTKPDWMNVNLNSQTNCLKKHNKHAHEHNTTHQSLTKQFRTNVRIIVMRAHYNDGDTWEPSPAAALRSVNPRGIFIFVFFCYFKENNSK